MNYLLYQAYGQLEVIHEMLYSLMTFYCRNEASTVRNTSVIIYTDQQEYLQRFLQDCENIIYVPVTPAMLQEWKGEINFTHRVKIQIIKDVFSKYNGKIIYLDTDTTFLRDVTPVFKTISEQDVFMHVLEGAINSRVNRVMVKTERFVKKNKFEVNGKLLQIPLEMKQWNAGVLGLHPCQACILEEVTQLTESIYKLWDMNIAEQFSFSYFLGKDYTVHEAKNYIFHYWYFKEFRAVANEFFEYHKGKTLKSLIHLTDNINPMRLEKPKMAYRSLHPFMRYVRRRMGEPWKMPHYSLD